VLRVAVALDVTLGGDKRTMSSQQLSITQRTAGLGDEARGLGNESALSRMAGAAAKAHGAVKRPEPVDQTVGLQVSATPGSNDGTLLEPSALKNSQSTAKVRMDGNAPALTLFGMRSSSSIVCPTLPSAFRTMGHSNFAISAALRPALTESKMMTRLRAEFLPADTRKV
jgi:hypothetical protein